jgi:tagatose-1,6-bisphosphate aldolase
MVLVDKDNDNNQRVHYIDGPGHEFYSVKKTSFLEMVFARREKENALVSPREVLH